MTYKPQIFVVVTNDKPGEPHVAGAYNTYEEAKHARTYLFREEQLHIHRTTYDYEIWQMTIGNTTLPPKTGG